MSDRSSTWVHLMTLNPIQETGLGGRDGKPSLALLFVIKRTRQFCDKSMKNYIDNNNSMQEGYII